jgi:hypothetical protein
MNLDVIVKIFLISIILTTIIFIVLHGVIFLESIILILICVIYLIFRKLQKDDTQKNML